MKKLLTICLFLLVQGLYGQNTVWSWDQYGLSFEAPSKMTVTQNNEISFSSEMDGLALGLELFDYEGLSPETLGEFLGEAAVNIGMKITRDVGPLALTSLAGAYIDGTVDGTPMTLALLFDTESNIGVMVSIAFLSKYDQTVSNIINSFKMTPP